MHEHKRILVVDDEENLCLLYRDELESEGYQVRTVCDATTAIKMIDAEPPDLIVLDIRMPRMDGIEAMGRMLGRRNNLPIILNTAYTSYKDDFRSWPADAYVVKSSDTSELKRAIKRVLRSHGALHG